MAQLIQSFPLPIFSAITTVLFFTFFVCLFVWVFKGSSRETWEAKSRIPFEENEADGSATGVNR